MYLKIILSPKRRELFKKLAFLKEYGWYLAGGTALALQIGHRTSLDFDFYSPKKFDPNEVLAVFEEKFPNQIEVLQKAENTLGIVLEGFHLSCFYYPYPLIRPLVLIEEIPVASLEDIAAMKIIAIIQRGTKRDFIDIYYLIRKLGLARIFKLTTEKYPMFNIYLGLRALIYFEDAEKEPKKREIKILDPQFSWLGAKKFLLKEVKNYQRSFIQRG